MALPLESHTKNPSRARAGRSAGPWGPRFTALARLTQVGEKLLRTAGTGLLFAAFGIGGLLLIWVLLPVRLLLRRRAEPKDFVTQRLVHRGLAVFLRFGEWLRLLQVRWHGVERLSAGPVLVVANHPTLLDVVVLLSRMPQADCVVKEEAWRNPFLRPVVTSARYLPNESGNALIERCAERLRSGRSVILFPEGSRSPERGLRTFKRGAAHIALRSTCPILPVVILCDPPALKKGQTWYRLPNKKLCFDLRVGEALCPTDFGTTHVPLPIVARRITDALRSYFALELRQ